MGAVNPMIKERTHTYNGLFDLKSTYSFVKNYLEETKHYDVTEKEVNEKSGDKQEIISKLAADLEYNDYYKIKLTFELNLSGKPVLVEDSNGKTHSLVDGTAKITVNGYLEKDFMNKRPVGPLKEFLDKVYGEYLNKDEKKKMAGQVSRDVGELITKFKQQVNSNLK